MDWLATSLLNNTYSTTNSGVLGEKDPTAIFDALAQQQYGMENLSNQFLQTGIDQYLNKEYSQAAKSFAAAISLSPNSSYNVESSKYLVQSYLKLDETDKAIETYQAAIQRNPDRDDLRTALGQLYYSEDRYAEAVEQYRSAVQVNPSATNRYSFGEALIKVQNYGEAEYQFQVVKRLDPKSYAGDYGLGKMYAQAGDYEKAIEHFEDALEIEPTFFDARAEIGYAYADMGSIDKAWETHEKLQEVDETLAQTLTYYIEEKEPPRIALALANGTFPYTASKGYPVSAINSYLENAGAKKGMTMQFLFTKEMNPASVEDRFSWMISRASSANLAETYNYGDTIPTTEISIDPFPDYVVYNNDTMIATVGFTIRQNENADGTIDPSHIVFKFDGEDIYGVSMDPAGDEFSGFSRSV